MTLDVVLGGAFDKEAATFILGELVRGYSCSPQVHIHTLDELAHVDPMAFPPKALHSLDDVGIKVSGTFRLVKIDERLERKFARTVFSGRMTARIGGRFNDAGLA